MSREPEIYFVAAVYLVSLLLVVLGYRVALFALVRSKQSPLMIKWVKGTLAGSLVFLALSAYLIGYIEVLSRP